MTMRNGKAKWYGSVKSGSGTITVSDGVFESAYSYETRVHDAYRSCASATGPRARVAFRYYTSALDAEEWAAEAFAILVRRVGYAETSHDDLSGHLAA